MNESGSVERVPVGGAGGKKGGGGALKLILVALIAGGGVGGAVFFLLPKLQHKAPAEVVESAAVENEAPSNEPKPFGEVYQMTDIVINPASSRRVFMVTVALEVANKEMVKEIQKREPLLRDNLITMFASQPLDVLIDIKYRQAFRARVKKVMDYQLGEGAITRVFFEKWVFQ